MKYKTNLLILILLLLVTDLIAQSSAEIDRENNERYWIYRDRFRKKFVNIGGVEDGQSLPFIQLRENYDAPVIDKIHLTDHITDEQKKAQFTINYKGRISKGEMGIELGNYLAVLATEYRLLKWDGAGTEQMTAIRNELYYAINAINRLDKNAEKCF